MMDQSTSRRESVPCLGKDFLSFIHVLCSRDHGTRVTAIVTVELVGGTGLGMSETSMIII